MVWVIKTNKYREKSSLFEGRWVWEDEKMRELQGAFPVVAMSFAG